MRMIGRGNGDSINLIGHFIEHNSVIFVFRSIWNMVEGFRGLVPVYVTEGDHIFAEVLTTHRVTTAHAAYADAGNVQFFIGRQFAGNDPRCIHAYA